MKVLPSFLRSFLVSTAALALASVSALAATQYSDITTFSGNGFAGGGATGSGIFTTSLVADDLAVAAGAAGQLVNGFTFSVANFNASSVSARALVSFYADNGTGSGPGTLLSGFVFNPISFASGSVGLFTFTSSAIFTLPLDGRIWAGVAFDNGGGSTATQAQLNNLGQGLFNPPTVGSSQDIFFQSSSSFNGSSNPSGGFFNFSGNPVANFGWALNGNVVTAVPDSGATILLLLVGCAGLAVLRRLPRRVS